MEIILLCLYGKVTVIVIFLIIYLYWIWKKVRLIKWEQAPGDTRDWIRNHEKNINKIIKIISGIGLIFMVYCIVIPAILDIPTLVKQEYAVGQFKLPSDIDTPNTQIFYFYGGKINEFVFRKVAKYIKKNYKNSTIICLKGKGHCEDALLHSNEWIHQNAERGWPLHQRRPKVQ